MKSRNLALTGITSDGRESPRFKLPNKWLKLIDSEFKVSEQCCYYMKEKPMLDYAKENDVHYIIGTKAEDSQTRQSSYLGTGCNSFKETGNSNPLGFWTHQDILRYIVENELDYSEEYGEIVETKNMKPISKLKLRLMVKYDRKVELVTTKASRTGCFICGFGLHMEKQPNRFQRMELDEPKMYDYAINKMGYGELLDFLEIPYRMEQMPDLIEFGNQISFFD